MQWHQKLELELFLIMIVLVLNILNRDFDASMDIVYDSNDDGSDDRDSTNIENY